MKLGKLQEVDIRKIWAHEQYPQLMEEIVKRTVAIRKAVQSYI